MKTDSNVRLFILCGVILALCSAYNLFKLWRRRVSLIRTVRGFDNVEIINSSIRALFSRLSPARIRQFSKGFTLLPNQYHHNDDPVIRVQKIAKTIAEFYGIKTSTIVVTFKDDLKVPGRVELSPDWEFFVEIRSTLRFATDDIITILVHEVAHIFLYQSGIKFEPVFNNEVLTDTTAVFLGCGSIILNGALLNETKNEYSVSYNLQKYGYLSIDEYGYIMAKRDEYFSSVQSKDLQRGLPRIGYKSGRRRLQAERSRAPFVPSTFAGKILKYLLFWTRKVSNENGKNIFACIICGQKLKTPKINKKLLVTCPTCSYKSLCHS